MSLMAYAPESSIQTNPCPNNRNCKQKLGLLARANPWSCKCKPVKALICISLEFNCLNAVSTYRCKRTFAKKIHKFSSRHQTARIHGKVHSGYYLGDDAVHLEDMTALKRFLMKLPLVILKWMALNASRDVLAKYR